MAVVGNLEVFLIFANYYSNDYLSFSIPFKTNFNTVTDVKILHSLCQSLASCFQTKNYSCSMNLMINYQIQIPIITIAIIIITTVFDYYYNVNEADYVDFINYYYSEIVKLWY